ncbi:MAG: HAD family hydrolase [Candidatus Methanomethylicaceae archaeon]
MKFAIVFDKSGTILKPCRVAFDIKRKKLLYHISTLKLVKDVDGYLLNIEGDIKKIKSGKQKPFFKISCTFSKILPKIEEDIILKKEILEALEKVEEEAIRHCNSEIETCIALILNNYGEPIYAIGLGGRIYEDFKNIVDEIRSKSDIFIATGNCKNATLKFIKKLKINKHFVIYNASPKEKMEFVKMLKLFYAYVIMVGNDINDLMAMKEADISIFVNRENEDINYDVDYIIKSLNDLPKIISELNFKIS